MTHSRYLPSFVERTSHGITETNPCSTLFEDRIVFLGTPIDDASAGDVSAQLILESTPAAHTGRTVEQVHSAIDRDGYLTADEAVAYGPADLIVPSRERRLRGAR